jgi:hypothetical protein
MTNAIQAEPNSTILITASNTTQYAPFGVELDTSLQAMPSTKRQVLRKLYGIVLRFEGPLALVALKSDQGPVEYYFESKLLEENSVTVEQQPFEYQEGKNFLPDGRIQRFTEIIPAAPASSAQIEALTLDVDYAAKRQRILNYFASQK